MSNPSMHVNAISRRAAPLLQRHCWSSAAASSNKRSSLTYLMSYQKRCISFLSRNESVCNRSIDAIHDKKDLYQRLWFSDDRSKDTSDESDSDDENPLDQPNESEHSLESLEGDLESFSVEVVVNMPDMGEGNENKIEKWYRKKGDVIKRNDVLCDITTPDFTFGMVTEDEFDAIMGEIHVEEGEVADDDAPICTIYHQEVPGTPAAEKNE